MPNVHMSRVVLLAAPIALVSLAAAGPLAQAPQPSTQASAATTQAAGETPALNWQMSRSGDIGRILPLRDRARVQNEILEWRLDNILIEFSVAADIPEWGGVEVSTGFEDEAVFTGGTARWVDGYPRTFYLIR